MKEPIETPEPIKVPQKNPKPLSGQMVAGIKASLELVNSIRKTRKETGHAIGTIITEIRDSTMGELMNQLENILRRSPQIGVEVTRMMASIPEKIRGATVRVIEGRELIPEDIGD
jgi:hypothetical protein